MRPRRSSRPRAAPAIPRPAADVAGLVALGLCWALAAGCGSAETRADSGGPEAAARGDALVWFAASAASCDEVVAALEAHGALPGVVIPEAVRTASSGTWCALADAAGRQRRADSWARGVSAALEAPTMSFFVWSGRWSYALFDDGDPIVALESHYGDPVIVGDVDRGAQALGVDARHLRDAQARAGDPAAHRALAAHLGITVPSEGGARRALEAARSADDAPEDTRPPFEPGEWVVMPPLGVMLLREHDTRTIEGDEVPVYVVVEGAAVLTVPIAKARRMGMRPLASAEEADAVLAIVAGDADVDRALEYREARAREQLNALKRGDLLAIARAFSEVCDIADQRRLFAMEEALFDSLRSWLVAELSAAKETPPDAIRAILDGACG